jgi:hypothetical protein
VRTTRVPALNCSAQVTEPSLIASYDFPRRAPITRFGSSQCCPGAGSKDFHRHVGRCGQFRRWRPPSWRRRSRAFSRRLDLSFAPGSENVPNALRGRGAPEPSRAQLESTGTRPVEECDVRAVARHESLPWRDWRRRSSRGSHRHLGSARPRWDLEAAPGDGLVADAEDVHVPPAPRGSDGYVRHSSTDKRALKRAVVLVTAGTPDIKAKDACLVALGSVVCEP